MLIVNDQISVPLRELKFSFARSGGPGGQNVNKVNTKVLLKWEIDKTSALPSDVLERFKQKFRRRINNEGELMVTSQRFRDQGRNVADCLGKLKLMILEVVDVPRRRRKTKVSQGQKRRRLEDKRRQSEKKRLRRPPAKD